MTNIQNRSFKSNRCDFTALQKPHSRLGRPEGFMNIVSGNSQDFTCLTQCEYLGCNLFVDGLSVGHNSPLLMGRLAHRLGLQLAYSQFLKFPKII